MKPSIFSKDYNRYIKRKRRIKLIISAVVLVILCSLFIFGFGIKPFFDKILNSPVKPITEETAKQKETVPSQKPAETENKFKEIKLSDSLTVKVGLIIEGTVTKYNGILTEGLNSSFDISQAGNQMVYLDKDTQTLYLIDKDGKSTDITYKKYVSRNKTVYEKDSVLKKNADYIWADSPKFLGEGKILYISNVPWFGTNRRQYLWIYDIKTNTYTHNLRGNSIILNGLKDKGYEIKLDDKLVYLNNDGGLVK
ncbi:MAG: hypothetical protein LIR50_11185 [Bacillota bacterium]|nr:hypothetical protein [Bacillota bacterium]